MSEQKTEIDGKGWQLVLVHMSPDGKELPIPEGSPLSDVPRISDPDCELYRAFGLGKGTFRQLFHPRIWWRGFQALRSGSVGGGLQGDGLQLSGMFLVRDGKVVASHTGTDASDIGDSRRLEEVAPA